MEKIFETRQKVESQTGSIQILRDQDVRFIDLQNLLINAFVNMPIIIIDENTDLENIQPPTDGDAELYSAYKVVCGWKDSVSRKVFGHMLKFYGETLIVDRISSVVMSTNYSFGQMHFGIINSSHNIKPLGVSGTPETIFDRTPYLKELDELIIKETTLASSIGHGSPEGIYPYNLTNILVSV